MDLAGRGDLEAAQGPLDGDRGVQLRAGSRAAAAQGHRPQPARPLRLLEPTPFDGRLRGRVRDVRRRRRDRALGDPGARLAGLRVHPGRRARARHARRPARARLGRGARLRRRAHADRGHRPHQRDGGWDLRRAPGHPPVPRQQRRDVDGQRRLRLHRPGPVRTRDRLRCLLPRVRRRPLGFVRAARRRPRRQADRAGARLDQDARARDAAGARVRASTTPRASWTAIGSGCPRSAASPRSSRATRSPRRTRSPSCGSWPTRPTPPGARS